MHPLVALVAAGLDAHADPERATRMAAYMKTEMPFFGVMSGTRRSVLRDALATYPITSDDMYREVIQAFFDEPEREQKYCAIDIAVGQRRFIGTASVPLYARLISTGAWWDLVDDLAIKAVGKVLLDHPDVMEPLVETWIDGPDMWLRRTALISRIKHKAETDQTRLFDHCLRRSFEKEFFIRKAIGWALREYAKTAPAAVASFLKANREELSGLSFREASKHLDIV